MGYQMTLRRTKPTRQLHLFPERLGWGHFLLIAAGVLFRAETEA